MSNTFKLWNQFFWLRGQLSRFWMELMIINTDTFVLVTFFLEMGYPDTGRICLGSSCKIWKGFYTYTRAPTVSKSAPKPAPKLHKQI